LAVLLSACTEKLEDMNVDVKNATTTSPESFFGASVLNLARLMGQNFSGPSVDMPVGVGLYLSQQLTNATHTTEPRYFYDGNTDWDFVYKSVLRNLYEAEKLLVAEQANGGENLEIANKLASIAILKVYTYTVLVDIFGNVPYSQALDVDNVTPVYDDAESVYLDLIERLNQAIAALDASVASFGDYDLLYNGDVSKWQKFANSLKLRFGLKVIDVLPELGSTLATEAIEAGVFSGNEDNAVFHFLSSPPNNHSLWVVLVQNPRLFYVGAKPFVDLMNAYEDPRRAVYFSRLNGGFVGGQIGLVLNYNSYSHLGDYFHRPDLPCILLDFSNVSFLLAEAAERGIAGGTDAKTHYETAIRASMEYYGIDESVVSDYLSLPNVAYEEAGVEWKEKIGTQKWIALFMQGFEAWTEYRRLDYPVLEVPVDAFVDQVPTRLVYPRSEHSLNPNNYQEAAAAMGGDLLTVKLFWDNY